MKNINKEQVLNAFINATTLDEVANTLDISRVHLYRLIEKFNLLVTKGFIVKEL